MYLLSGPRVLARSVEDLLECGETLLLLPIDGIQLGAEPEIVASNDVGVVLKAAAIYRGLKVILDTVVVRVVVVLVLVLTATEVIVRRGGGGVHHERTLHVVDVREATRLGNTAAPTIRCLVVEVARHLSREIVV